MYQIFGRYGIHVSQAIILQVRFWIFPIFFSLQKKNKIIIRTYVLMQHVSSHASSTQTIPIDSLDRFPLLYIPNLNKKTYTGNLIFICTTKEKKIHSPFISLFIINNNKIILFFFCCFCCLTTIFNPHCLSSILLISNSIVLVFFFVSRPTFIFW